MLCTARARGTRSLRRYVLHPCSGEHVTCGTPPRAYSNITQIDYLQSTLVVLGSRGRSALKGVLLGSFSNYLVTKSSVPVMVARKKLKKHTKTTSVKVRLANNLQQPNELSNRRLSLAKID